jgi:hypothetical protein
MPYSWTSFLLHRQHSKKEVSAEGDNFTKVLLCARFAYPIYIRRNALRIKFSKEFLEDYIKEEAHCEVQERFTKWNIMRHLWLTANRRGKIMKPQALYVLTAAKFEVFAHTLESMKLPTRYSSNLGKHIRDKKFGALKSHDYHLCHLPPI